MRGDDVDDKPDYNSPSIGAVDWRRTGNGWDGHWRFYSVMGVGMAKVGLDLKLMDFSLLPTTSLDSWSYFPPPLNYTQDIHFCPV